MSRAILTIAVLVSILAATPAAARKAPPQVSSSPAPTLEIGGTEGEPVPVCTAGHNLPPTVIVHPWLAPPDDAYYTLIDPASCGTCPEGILVTKAHIVLNFQAPCQQPVVVSVVRNVGTAQCPYPDPSQVLCPPEIHVLNAAAPGQYDFSIPLNISCLVTEKAFLAIEFDAFGPTCNQSFTEPQLVIAGGGPCNECTSYNFYPPVFQDDECGPEVHFPGPPVHYVDAQCGVTPALPTHWGRLKVLYR